MEPKACVVVYDAKSGEEITRSVLTQIIFEQESKGQNLLPIKFLRQLIRFYGDQMQALAREFGFCYGVDRAVDYAYQARKRFPDQQVFLTGEIIHNPHVNDQLRGQSIRFLSDPDESLDRLRPEDVVILPAFGVTILTAVAIAGGYTFRAATDSAARRSNAATGPASHSG